MHGKYAIIALFKSRNDIFSLIQFPDAVFSNLMEYRPINAT